MVTKKAEPFKQTPIPGTLHELETIALSHLADRHFAYNQKVLSAGIEAIVAKLVIERTVKVTGFGIFTAVHLPKKYMYNGLKTNTAVVFLPDEQLIMKLESVDAKF